MKNNIIRIMLSLILVTTLVLCPVFATGSGDGSEAPDWLETSGETTDGGTGNEGSNNNGTSDESTPPLEGAGEMSEPMDLIKVGLKYGSSANSSYTFYSNSGFIVADVSDTGFSEKLSVTEYNSVVLVYEGGYVTLKGSDGSVLLQDFASSAILAADYADGGTITVNDLPYRDGFAVTVNSSGMLNLINVLDVEHYVYGVLDSEMYHDNPLEALKAQAVAARSFAKLNMDRHSSYGFDLCTGTHCQVYKGYSDEYARTNQAVDETAGLCLYYNDKPVSAYYFKNSGGHTQNIKDVWGSSLGYLVGVKDDYSPDYPWSVSYTFDELETKLNVAGKGVGNITSVEIASRNDAGAVNELKFNGTSGSTTLSRENIRTFFGSTILKSTMFSLADSSNSENAGNSSSENGSGSSGNNTGGNGKITVVSAYGTTTLEGTNVSVLGADGAAASMKLADTRITNGTDTVKASSYLDETANDDKKDDTPIKDSGIVAVSEVVSSGPVTFVGKGYGHGIGMPQDSAVEMAKQGFAFDEILEYYYTGIEIK